VIDVTTPTSKLDLILSMLADLSPVELIRLRTAIDTFLPVEYLEAESIEHIYYKFIKRGGKVFGPYRHRRVIIGGQLINRYEGKADPGEYEAWLKSQVD
jgi:hypothetical protein